MIDFFLHRNEEESSILFHEGPVDGQESFTHLRFVSKADLIMLLIGLVIVTGTVAVAEDRHLIRSGPSRPLELPQKSRPPIWESILPAQIHFQA
jgi:hypothetical protein